MSAGPLPSKHGDAAPRRAARKGVCAASHVGLLFALLLGLAAHHPAQANSPRELTPGRAVSRQLPAGSAHSFELRLDAGRFVRLALGREDLQLSVTLREPGGGVAVELVARRYGPVSVPFVARASGPHTLELRSLEADGAAGRYELSIAESRPATQADSKDEAAGRLLAEAENARALWTEQGLRAAARNYEEAARHWQATSRPARAAESLLEVGEIHLGLSQYPQALEAFRRAAQASRAARDSPGEFRARNFISRVLILLGDTSRALADTQRALAFYRQRREPREEARALLNLGEIRYSFGELKEAVKQFTGALDAWGRAGDRRGQAAARLGLGYAHVDSGELPQAAADFEQSLALSRSVGDRRGEALAQTAAGAVNSFRGERQKALGLHQQALAIFRAVGARQDEAVALNSIGQVYEDLGEPRSALDHYRLALDIYQQNRSRDFEAVTHYYLGRVSHALGDHAQALTHYGRCLALARAQRKRRVEAYALMQINAVNLSLGRRGLAVRQLREALRLHQRAGDRRGQANTLKSLGDIYSSAGEPRRAAEAYRRALAFSRRAGDRKGQPAILYQLALSARDAGDTDAALRHVNESIAIVEDLRVQVASPALRASYFASVHKHYGLLISLLMRLHRERPHEGFAAAALQASEKRRARALLETLLEAGADLRLGVDPALLARERELQQTLNARAVYHMRLLNSSRTESQAEEVGRDIRRLTDEYHEVQARIRLDSPRYAGLTEPQLLSLGEIQAALRDEGAVLLEYALGEEESHLWAVTADGVRSFGLPARARLEAAAREVYELLTARAADDSPPDAYRERVLAADRDYWPRAAALSSMLLGEVAPQLAGKRLLVVADGALQYLPFEALPAPGDPSPDPRPLVLSHEVVYLPSASTLAALRRDATRAGKAPRGVIVLADPVFGPDDPRVRREAGPAQAEAVRVSTGLDPGGALNLAPLPSTLDEARAILDAAEDEGGTLASGFRASRAAATGDELGRYRVVHFATHGVVNGEHPELSGIVLSMVNERGEPENGFLQLHDIYGLRLAADLVVLSSCSTALGKEVRGEGLVGLTRAFMYAGAKGVVASLWKVDDRASAELMGHFYRALLGEGQTPAAALRGAKERMWAERRWRAPFYWAAFQLQGEYRQRVRTERGAGGGVVLAFAALALASLLAAACSRPLSRRFSRRRP